MTSDGNRARRDVHTVQLFLDFLEQSEFRKAADLFAEDAVQLIPYAWGSQVPREFRGRQAIFELYNALPLRFGPAKFINREIWAGASVGTTSASASASVGTTVAFAKYSGRIPILTGGEYANDYYGLWRFNAEGLIVEYSEIWDPIRISQTFGFPLP
eukprot:ANDGO_02727.mRNA.1 hypothetical protein